MRSTGPVPGRRLGLAALLALPALLLGWAAADPGHDWPVYGGDHASSHYSPLDQINRGNVQRLRVAWVYHTGDARAPNRSEIQCNPIVVDGVLYATSPGLRVFALRAGTGEEIWSFDPATTGVRPDHVNRGVTYWSDGDDRRILFTAGSRLFALDARTGRPVPGFGGGRGWVGLREGLGRDTAKLYVIATSPGVVYRDLLIQGTRVSESEGAAPGHVRAFDVRTGAVRWTFHTIPQPGEYGAESWPADGARRGGGANSWPGMSLDVERGVVYVPTGSPAFDFYGGDRPGANLFGNSLLALDAATGRRIWHFQTVHHDLWDRDLPAPPNLLTVTHDGRRVDAVAQITKSGFVFLFDRETGKPLFPVEERQVRASDLRGERSWPTQPVPLLPAPFGRQRFTEADVTDRTPEAHAAVLARLRTLRSDGQFVPPSLEGTVVFPGFDGGGEWGGAAVDPTRGVMYVNESEMPWIARMVEKAPTADRSGAGVFAAECAGCHGPDRRGGDRGPSLVDVGRRLGADEIRKVLETGRGFMPSFARLPTPQKEAVIAYLLGRAPAAPPATSEASSPDGEERVPYRFAGYERFLDPDGYPAVRPPWGTLNAIDLNRGTILWRIPLGTYPELIARGLPPTGTENYGGPLVTAGGLLFIGATRDEHFHAFDQETGQLLWETTLPAGGYATPSSYEVDGRQFVVIAAGGGKMGTKSGDAYVAFALPR
jgi:quinoprotein glucose dehydrogenase